MNKLKYRNMKKILVYINISILVVLLFSSCKKEDITVNSNNQSSIIGKWGFPVVTKNDSFTGYWTFNSDGTMDIDNKNDLLDGTSTTYSYDSNSNKLTLGGGFVVHQIIWISNKQFKIQGNGSTIEERILTKVD